MITLNHLQPTSLHTLLPILLTFPLYPYPTYYNNPTILKNNIPIFPQYFFSFNYNLKILYTII